MTFVVIVDSPSGDKVYFGPFKTSQQANAWAMSHLDMLPKSDWHIQHVIQPD